jgi:hypothetical protein
VTDLPRWLTLALGAALAWLCALGVAGLTFAMAGWFRLVPLALATAALAVPLTLGWVRAVPRAPATRSTHVAAAVAVALVVGVTAWHVANHAQHLVADRDPGVYVTTARWLVAEGDLRVDGPTGPFVTSKVVRPHGAGFSPLRDGDPSVLAPQFPHLTAVVLAAPGLLRPGAIVVAGPLVAGLALLALYGAAASIVGARWALMAPALLAATMPWLVIARDAYSEPVTVAAIFGGLWALHVALGTRRAVPWLLAGALVGLACMARVDAYLYLGPVLAGLAVATRSPRTWALGPALATAGLVGTASIALLDTAFLTGSYFDTDLAPRLPAMVALAAGLGFVTWLAAPHLWPASAVLRHGTAAAAAALALAALWARFVRPDLAGLPERIDEGGRYLLDLLPQAATGTMLWLEWYLGPVALAAGIAGLLALLVGLGRPRWPQGVGPVPEAHVLALLGVVLVGLVLYLWTPEISPDHPWAMRRFAAVGLPGLAIGVAVAARALWALARPRASALVAGAAPAVLVAASLGPAVAATAPVAEVRPQVPMRHIMNEVCDVLGPDVAVLVTVDGLLTLMLPEAVQAWCGVPAAGASSAAQVRDAQRLAIAWREEGRRLIVLSALSREVSTTLAGQLRGGRSGELAVIRDIFLTGIQPTLTVRPDELGPDPALGRGPYDDLTIHLYEVVPRSELPER